MKTYQILGYSGLLPFIFFLYLFQYIEMNLYIDPSKAFIFYSAMIFSFVAGTLWRKENFANNNAQIISNLFCLYGFFCLFPPALTGLTFLLCGYILLFIAEFIITDNKSDQHTISYLKMRFMLTGIVSLLHLTAIALLY